MSTPAPGEGLGRLPQFDDRSRAYPIRALLPATIPERGRTWRCSKYLDQGREGACVGFAWAHELAAAPVRVRNVNNATARALYHAAQIVDEWPGEDYEGSSVLAGAKVLTIEGHLRGYRWAFGIGDVLDTIAAYGPVVLGIDWHDSMYTPDERGFIHASGEVVGGHAILARGVRRVGGDWVVRLRNSWGRSWGQHGDCFIRAVVLGELLAAGGEACVPDRVPVYER